MIGWLMYMERVVEWELVGETEVLLTSCNLLFCLHFYVNKQFKLYQDIKSSIFWANNVV
jgi:hypothetical protein